MNLYNAIDSFLDMIRPYPSGFIRSLENPQGKIVMVFDTETTGLIPRPEYGDKTVFMGNMPYVIQLSFVLWDIDNDWLVQKYNRYIRIPQSIEISQKITELTGITRDMCDADGVPMIDALAEFYTALIKCDVVVAHNISFDKQMMEVETQRWIHNLEHRVPQVPCIEDPMDLSLFCKTNNIEMVCSMLETIDICGIKKSSKYGKEYNKWPTLTELYVKLFGKRVENMHNAIVDVLVCLRCYLKYKHAIEIDNGMFNEYIRDGIVGVNN